MRHTLLAETVSPVTSFLAAPQTTSPPHRRATRTAITAPLWTWDHLSGVAKAPPIPKCTLEPRWLDCDDDDGDDGGDHDDGDEDADVDVVWR